MRNSISDSNYMFRLENDLNTNKVAVFIYIKCMFSRISADDDTLLFLVFMLGKPPHWLHFWTEGENSPKRWRPLAFISPAAQRLLIRRGVAFWRHSHNNQICVGRLRDEGAVGGTGEGVDRQQLEGAHNTPPQMLVAEEDECKASKVQTNVETMSGRKSHCPVCHWLAWTRIEAWTSWFFNNCAAAHKYTVRCQVCHENRSNFN